MSDDGKFDDLLLAMANKHKNVEDLSYSVLSFFERRTDLFHVMDTPQDRMGFMPGVAEQMVLKHFRFFQHKYLGKVQPDILKRAYGVTEPPEGIVADSPDAAAAGASERKALEANTAISTPQEAVPDTSAEGIFPEKAKKMMKHISTWNGAATDKYYWSQSIRDVTLEIEVDECTAKNVIVDISATRLSVKVKDLLVLEGKLYEKVHTEESMWQLEDNCKVIISLDKHRETWWKCVLVGDQEIDTTKVESTRAMDEYDGETQGAIRKIMFDQNQKVLGQPTSDQIRTADVMKQAWNAPGSPFRGTEFDPTALNLSGPVSEDFFADLEKQKIEHARTSLGSTGGGTGGSAAGP